MTSWMGALAVATILLQQPVAGPLPRVLLETDAGAITLEVDILRAPVTAGNFLKYVDAGLYDGGRFHRTVTTTPDNQPRNAVKIAVVQAGANASRRRELLPPIALESTATTGLTHADGVVSMARAAPDTARDQFFICIGDQPELDAGGRRNPDGRGFAAFARVVEGMAVVRRIHRSPASGQDLTPPIRIVRARRLQDRP